MSIRNRLFAAAAVVSVSALALAGCSSDSADSSSQGASGDTVTLKVGASPTPHGKILTYVKDNLAKKEGLNLEIVEFQDYVQPNASLKSGDIDANFFQTVPYLEEQSKKQGFDFDHGEGIHLEPLGIYSSKLTDIKDVKDAATVGIINDPTNQARALNLLSHVGLLKLPENADLNVAEVAASREYNPKNLVFLQVEGPQLIRSLDDVDIAVINGNFAQSGGKSPKDAIALESTENNPSVNVLVWNAKSDKLEAIKKLDALLHSDEVRAYIEKTWPDKSVLPAF
ncbi:ABC transporter [Nanchangia anserum]|uniref:Lipoprotein n=1 Tax=Nanchangia anserum TaxID=2692125 RepID=A0A8I0G972_9ACTO|nr:MetQ/NlpA family ABC transporter substrate-binding protein [Nanchangia anserum]MBD3689474.1 ABC transporter [Nanchangia anserum]QOX81668.1 ABC transporter [Nanchangia anserum]